MKLKQKDFTTFADIANLNLMHKYNLLLSLIIPIFILTIAIYHFLYKFNAWAFIITINIQVALIFYYFKMHLNLKEQLERYCRVSKLMANYLENSVDVSFLSDDAAILINHKLARMHNIILENQDSENIYESIIRIFCAKTSDKTLIKNFFEHNRKLQKSYKLNIGEKLLHYNIDKLISDDDYQVKINNNPDYNFKYLNITPYQSINHYEAFNMLNVGVYELDQYGNITFINEYLANILGFTVKDFLSQSLKVEEIIIDKKINKKNIKSKLFGNWQDIIQLRTKFDDKITVLVTHNAIFVEHNEIKKIIGYVVKVSNRNVLAQTQSDQDIWLENAWQCFFHDTSLPIALLDKTGKILKSNVLFSSEISLRKNKSFIEYFDEESQKMITNELDKFANDKTHQCIPFKVKLPNDDKILELYIFQIKNLKGEFYGYLARLFDITAQIQLEEKFIHSQRMQTVGFLAGSVAHDFNNILTIIIGYCDLLLEKHNEGDSSYKEIMQIKQSSDRAAHLVNRLLAFSRQQTMKPELLNLNESFADYYVLIQKIIGENIILKQNIANNLWRIEVDPVQLEQVILNLVVNSKHAMENSQKKELYVKVENIAAADSKRIIQGMYSPEREVLTAADYIAITISDSGHGIAKKRLSQIFEPFFSTKPKNFGTGLGLSTVMGIVKQSGGYLYVKSKEGVGTTFLMLFQKSTKIAPIAKKEEEITKINKLPISKNNILFLEDEEGIASFAITALENRGYNVYHYKSAIDALAALSKQPIEFDLVISDVIMPGMSGPEFIKKIKDKYQFEVIFISGYGEEVFNKEFGTKRNFHILQKPFTIRNLLNKIDEVSNLSPAKQRKNYAKL